MLFEFHFDWNHLDAESVADTLEGCVEMVGWQENIKGVELPRKFEGIVEEDKIPELELILAILATSLEMEVPSLHYRNVEEIDYLSENQKSFPPIEVRNFYIYGSHIKEPLPPKKTHLLLDAATAFGSGHHESTKGCLMAIDDLLQKQLFKNPLDLGCGSGILALALAKQSKNKVTASDIDPESVFVTKENAKLNGIQEISVYESDGFSSTELQKRAPFDLIVANILANPLCSLAKDMARYSTGHLILSGLLNEQSEMVLAAYEKEGFKLVDRYILGEWTTLSLTL